MGDSRGYGSLQPAIKSHGRHYGSLLGDYRIRPSL